jgi:hypothetical protein
MGFHSTTRLFSAGKKSQRRQQRAWGLFGFPWWASRMAGGHCSPSPSPSPSPRRPTQPNLPATHIPIHPSSPARPCLSRADEQRQPACFDSAAGAGHRLRLRRQEHSIASCFARVSSSVFVRRGLVVPGGVLLLSHTVAYRSCASSFSWAIIISFPCSCVPHDLAPPPSIYRLCDHAWRSWWHDAWSIVACCWNAQCVRTCSYLPNTIFVLKYMISLIFFKKKLSTHFTIILSIIIYFITIFLL